MQHALLYTKGTAMRSIDFSQLDVDVCKEVAAKYHAMGYNCAQAVACALAPALGLSKDTAFMLTEGFGAGMGGMSETCGAISGAVAIMGWLNSGGTEAQPKTKGQTYKLARQVAERFKEKNGTTICRELKGLDRPSGEPIRSCPGCIDDAVEIAIEVLGEAEDLVKPKFAKAREDAKAAYLASGPAAVRNRGFKV